jgi:DNA-directed RNA polymerase subunit H
LDKEFNVLKHELVPKHTILTEEEKKELLEKLKISPHQLPKILVSDPVVKAIGAREGDIIKIIRKSPTAGESIYYRIVTKK